MRRRSVGIGFGALAVLCAGLMVAWPGLAQQGHPLTGTWNGDWGVDTIHRNPLTLVLNWDGKSVTGEINPGPSAVHISSIDLDVTNWNVRIEADAKDKSGKVEHIIADGHLDDLGSYHRNITGTWRQGSATGKFKIVRD